MPQLMCEHRLDLGRGEARHQRVEEDDALGRAEAGEIGVAVAGALGAVHHEQAPGAEPTFGEQALDAAAQARILERRKFIEPAYKNGWVKKLNDQAECNPGCPRIHPPHCPRSCHEPQKAENERYEQHRPQITLISLDSVTHRQPGTISTESRHNPKARVSHYILCSPPLSGAPRSRCVPRTLLEWSCGSPGRAGCGAAKATSARPR